MSKDKNIHVVPHNDGWVVKAESTKLAGSAHPSQKQAIEATRERARRSKVELIVFRQDGRTREHDSYGNATYPQRDRP